MQKQVRKAGMILLLSIAMTALAACGNGNNGGSNQPSDASGNPSNAATEKPASGKKEKLVYYGFSEWVTDPNIATALGELKAKFESENPGYEVEFQSDPWGTWETKYKVMFASGNAPDVFIVNNPDFPTFANSGYLLDLGATLGEDSFNDFFPGILSMYGWEGKHMALPYTTDARVLWYNKEIFKQAGLDPEKPPTTWAELQQYAAQITEKTGGKVAGFGLDLGLKEFPAQSLYTATTGNVITVDNGTITPTVNTPEFKGYLQLLADMKPSYQADYATLDHIKVSTLFAQQKIGMVIAGTWVTDQNADLKEATFYGQSLVPKMDANAPYGSFGGGFGIAVSAKSKHPEAAAKLAQLFTSVEFNGRTMTDVPANNAALPASRFATDPTYAVFKEQIQYARQSQPKTLYYKEIDAAIYDTVTKVTVGGQPIDKAVSDLEAKIKEIAAQK
ncbi:extracellular solute-binding protein [Paenibacillus sp. NPDC058071]|uniref:extracellular solute-binding protein n=1 Tax=Paenibacillus sp. NPDC058071 TaxID=3346326 RepID=UPI0036D98371